jgi:hypothetical protein
MEAEVITPAAEAGGEAGITPAPQTEDGGPGSREMSASAASAAEPAGSVPAGDLEKVRELVLKANPDVVPDLVRGGSIDELLASVEPARGAYQRVAEAVRAGSGAETTAPASVHNPEPAPPPVVPAGGATNVVDPSTLAPTTKIAQGLAQQKSR